MNKTEKENSIISGKLVSTCYANEVIEIQEVDLSGYSGIWRDTHNDVLYYLIKENNEHFIVLVFDDNSFHKKKVIIDGEHNQIRIEVEESPCGECYLLRDDGFLEFWECNGRIDQLQNISVF